MEVEERGGGGVEVDGGRGEGREEIERRAETGIS